LPELNAIVEREQPEPTSTLEGPLLSSSLLD
jgi:hypothetical protein